MGNTNLGWLPNPRNERHILSNQLLQEFYQAVEKVSFYKDPLHFKNDFKVEERRRNDYSNLLDSLKEGLAFIQSNNDAAVGRFFENNDVILTRKDRAVLMLNRNKLSQLLAEIEENSSEIKIHHDSLFEENKLTLRYDWEKFKSDFDKDILKALLDLKSDAETKILVLKEKLSKIDELFPIDPSKELKEKKELKIRRNRENDRKTKNRFTKRMKKNAVELLNKLTPGITWTQDLLMKKKNAKDIEDVDLEVIYSLPANKAQYLGYIMLYDFFPHTVKCLIADGLSYTAKCSYEDVLDFNTAYFKKHEYAFINLEHGHELSENSDVSDSESDDNQDNDVQVDE